MKGLGICSCNAATAEEYRKIIKRRMLFFVGMIVVGIVTAGVAFITELSGMEVAISSRMLGYYSGIGVGFAFAGIILWLKHKNLLHNEEKLKQSRLESKDERLKAISDKSLRAAFFVLLVLMYLVMLIGGLFIPEIITVLGLILAAFLISYLGFHKYYSNKM